MKYHSGLPANRLNQGGHMGSSKGRTESKLPVSRIVGILKKIPIFKGLADDEYVALIDVCHVAQYPAGEILLEEGDAGHDMYVLLAGAVESTTQKAGPIYTMKPGEIFGEIAVVSHVHRTATAVVTEDSSFLRLSRDELDLLIGKAPRASYWIMRNIAQTLAERLMNADERLGVHT